MPLGLEQTLQDLLSRAGVPCVVRLPSGREIVGVSGSEPVVRMEIHSEDLLRRGLSEFELAMAYLDGRFKVEGDLRALFEIRRLLPTAMTAREQLRVALRMVVGERRRIARRAIARHYDIGNEFFLRFLDRRARLYSQCLFEGDERRTLEDAAARKLQLITEALGLRHGARLLDVGGGWGGVAEHASLMGAEVTALTISRESRTYMLERRESCGLKYEVRLENFLDHDCAEKYDAITILGVIEHIPFYRAFVEKAWTLLKPGALVYLDASATLEKYDMPKFMHRIVWGDGFTSHLNLPDLIRELLLGGFDVLEVQDETNDYWLTLGEWARRLDEHAAFLSDTYGIETYRAFRLYLWGGVWAMQAGTLQAYRVVARRRLDQGLRPGVGRRAVEFLRRLA